MYVVAFATHKPGRVQAGSEIQDAFADYLRNHPDHPDVVVFITLARLSPTTQRPLSAHS